MVARREYTRRTSGGKTGADGHTGTQALGQCHHIRQYAGVLMRKPDAGAAQAALHLIHHHQPVFFIAYLAHGAHVFVVRDVDAAFALDWFKQHGDHIRVVRGHLLDGRQVIKWHTDEAGNQRLEPGLRLAAAGG